jgi:protein involved in polysaccharide export with SLBB domain
MRSESSAQTGGVRFSRISKSRHSIWMTVFSLIFFAGLLVAGDALFAQEGSAGSVPEGSTSGAAAVSAEQIGEIIRARSAQEPAEEPQPQQPATTKTAQPQPAAKESAPTASAIEMLFSGQMGRDVNASIVQFGYDVFQQSVSTFAPVTDVPVGPDYVVGPGDSFTVTVWGRINAQYNVTVNRNGEVALPEVGVLKVSGMTLAEFEAYLQDQFSRKYTDFKMAVTMGRLRTIKVFVVGEAQAPGGYTVSSLSTVINALFAAGGPSKNGTLRNVRLTRTGQAPVTIDLYRFLLGGDKSGDVRLQDGDTIFVPLIGPVVGVAGNVKRPAIYEMSQPMMLAQVIDSAGGVTYAGWLQRVQVERVENHQRRIVADFDISQAADVNDQASKTLIRDGDLVKIFSVSPFEQNVIHLEGHAVRPGKYEFKPGMKLSDVITSYEALLPQANLEYGEIERLIEPDYHTIVIPFNLGRVLQGDASENIELCRFDTIRLFRWDQKGKCSVSVAGMVYRPGEYRFIPGMRLSELLDAAGGPQKNAYLKDAEITRRHISQTGMETEKIDVDIERVLAKDPQHDIALLDYDHLIVRSIPELEFDRMAAVSGQVKFPGTYPIRKGETLSSLIERAGGFTERAYLRGAIFTRESAKVVQQQRMDSLVRQLEESVLSSTNRAIGEALDEETVKSQEAALKAKKELVARLRAAQITGRVVVKLTSLDKFRGSRYDVELEKGDTLSVPEIPGVINVVGEVFNPTALLYEKGRTVSYYLNRVGGATKEADAKQINIIKADGSVVSIAQKDPGSVYWDSESHEWFFGGFMSIRLNPGDTIVVPRKLDRVFWLKATKDITEVLFQAALATGVVLAL